MRKLLEIFFYYYLTLRDLDQTLSFFTEDVVSIGTGEHEIAKGKDELRELMISEFEELPHPMKFYFYDFKEIPVTESVTSTFTMLRIFMEYEDEIVEMKARLTCTWKQIDGEWKACCVHMSVPAENQEEDTFFPLHYGKRAAGKLTADSGNRLMELISDALPGGIMGSYLDEGFSLYTVNDKMLEILGYTYEELVEVTGEKMLNIICEEDREYVVRCIKQEFTKGSEYEIMYRAIGKGNRKIWVSDMGRKIITEDGREAMISILTDISLRVENEEQLKFAAERDSLTELYNRKKAMSMIQDCFDKGEKGILFIGDVDNFKNVNDTKGHVIGDQILRQLADIMKAHREGISFACRLGGDEYSMFFYDSVEVEHAMEIIQTIQNEFYMYVKKLLPELNVSLSVGGAYRKEGETLNELYCRADEALYLAKRNKGTLVIL